jgi:membrane protease subunit HflC
MKPIASIRASQHLPTQSINPFISTDSMTLENTNSSGANRRSGQAKAALIVLATLVLAILLFASIYTVDEAEQAIVVQFGAPVGEPVTEPGLHFRIPFIQEIRRFDKRLLSWDGDPNQIPTVEEQFISVDTTARWRIVDPLKYLQSVQNEFGAQSRLNDILDSVVRDKIASSSLVDIVRSKDWKVSQEDLRRAMAAEADEEILLQKVEAGREELVQSILETAQKQMPQYGIELVDIRIKRINYVELVQQQVFERMIAERQRIAEQFRSEGQGRSAEIEGETDRLLLEIKSEAERDADVIRGMADAEATKIYNEAYGVDPEFYAFYRTLESYSKALGRGTTMMLGGDSEYFKYFQSSGSAGLPTAAPEANGATNAGQSPGSEPTGESQPE